MATENKKMALLRILQILQQETDIDTPLTHEKIAEMLLKDYGIEIERKAVGRTIKMLQEAGYEIETSKKGSYLLTRDFEPSELRLLIDSVLSSRYITAEHSKGLIEKLCAQGNKNFRSHVKNVYSVHDWNKTDNATVFLNIEIIDEAIEKQLKIQFNYNKYGADKKLHTSSSNVVSPYQMILHNQRYYLMAYHEKWKEMRYYRMDRITNIELLSERATALRSLKGYKNGIDYKKFSASLPYMYSDEPKRVEFLADAWVIDQVIDWFGKDIKITPQGDRCLVRINASEMAMEYWAMQYLNAVEIVAPQSLRDKIAENLQNGVKKYEGGVREDEKFI